MSKSDSDRGFPAVARSWKASRLRHYKFVSLSRQVWKRRLVFFTGAILVGLAAVLFAKFADRAQELYYHFLAQWKWLPLLLTPSGFAALAYVTRRWYPATAGSGIPQVIAARRSSDQEHRKELLGWKTMIAKIAMTTIALVIGASVGREGPTVQVGASIMFAVAGIAGMGRENGLVLAGSAAGIAAAFNAPLAGIVFAVEELAKAFAGRINDIVIGSVVIGGAVSWSLLGNYAYFGEVSARLLDYRDWLGVPICACFGGVLGGLFSLAMITATQRPPRFIGELRRQPILFAGLCGVIVAVLSISTAGYASGNGYGETRAGLVYGTLIPWWYGMFKFAATMASSLSGIPGGLFSPSLAVGAGLGSMIAQVVTIIDPRTVIILMTVGYFSGVVQSPLTAAVIVTEMTSDRNMVIPLIATSLFAASISRLINREPLYHALAREFSAGHQVAMPKIA